MGVVVGGWMAGTVAFMLASRWLMLGISTYIEVAKATEPSRPPIGKVASTLALRSLFHSAPWVILLIAGIGYYIREQPWAVWLFGGFIAGGGVMVVLFIYAAVQVRRKARKKRNAA